MKKHVAWSMMVSLLLANGLFQFALATEPVARPIIQTLELAETYHYPDTLSHAEGCARARARLISKAIEQTCGSHFSGGAQRVLSEEVDTFVLFHLESLSGKVIRFEERDRSSQTSQVGSRVPVFECALRAAVTVKCDTGQRDAAFLADLGASVRINTNRLRPGDPLQLSITPSDDAYFTVFTVMPYLPEGERVARIFPNDMQPGGRLPARARTCIPGPGCERAPYNMLAELPAGKKQVDEALLILATRQAVAFPALLSEEQLHGMLAELLLENRRELIIPYRVQGELSKP